MKKILFPTDFSDNAANALDYAINYVNQVKGHITLLHTYEAPATDGSFVSLDAYMRKDAFKEMSLVVERVRSKLVDGITFDHFVKRGNTVYIIDKMAKDYDMIIMGTQGASGLKEIFMGSVANAVIKNIALPVLAIPNGIRYKPIENVVITLDSHPLKGNFTLEPVKSMLSDFKADLLLFHTDRNMLDKGIDDSVINLLETVDYSIDYTISKENVNTAINEMVAAHGIDVLVMIKREKSWWESLFRVSVTSKEIFNSPVPLLILHDIDNIDRTEVDKYHLEA